jgi:hypothetical protein
MVAKQMDVEVFAPPVLPRLSTFAANGSTAIISAIVRLVC